jgi:hypothetical protein
MGLERHRQWVSAAARRVVRASNGSASVEAAVISITRRLLTGIAGPPTDLPAVGARLSVVDFRSEELPVAGELRRKDRTHFEVVYTSGMHLGRRRFTIAHELGHAFFEQTGPGCPRFGDELEKICDMFAAEFLMPTDLLGSRVPARPRVRDILEITNVFQVSIQAAVHRCNELRGLQAFGVGRSGDLSFTTGLVRKIDDHLARVTDQVWSGKAAEADVYVDNRRFHSRSWHIEGTRVGNSNLGLFVLWPIDAKSGTRSNTNHPRDEQAQKGESPRQSSQLTLLGSDQRRP